MKLAKSKLKQIIREEIRHILNEGYGSLTPEHIARLARHSNLARPILILDYLEDAILNYLHGEEYRWHRDDDAPFIDKNVYSDEGGRSTIGPQLAKAYQAMDARSQRRKLETVVEKYWQKLLSISLSAVNVKQPVKGIDLTFGDLLDVFAFHDGNHEDFKERLKYHIERILNKPPGKVTSPRHKAVKSRHRQGSLFHETN